MESEHFINTFLPFFNVFCLTPFRPVFMQIPECARRGNVFLLIEGMQAEIDQAG
jgi:hypothetical protein